MNHNSVILSLGLALMACGQVEAPQRFEPCERHERRLVGNVNGCWRITARRGFEQNGVFMCETEPSCEMMPGDAQPFVSGDVAFVGDVQCSNECKVSQ